MEVNNDPINIEDVDMMEIDQVQFMNRNFCTLESKVKVLDYIKENKVNPYKASEVFNNKFSVGQFINGK